MADDTQGCSKKHFSTWYGAEVGHGWTLQIKMAAVTLIDFSYLNRLALLTFTEVGPGFKSGFKAGASHA